MEKFIDFPSPLWLLLLSSFFGMLHLKGFFHKRWMSTSTTIDSWWFHLTSIGFYSPFLWTEQSRRSFGKMDWKHENMCKKKVWRNFRFNKFFHSLNHLKTFFMGAQLFFLDFLKNIYKHANIQISLSADWIFKGKKVARGLPNDKEDRSPFFIAFHLALPGISLPNMQHVTWFSISS